MISGHEVEYHLDTQQMLKFLVRKSSLKFLSIKTGIALELLQQYSRGDKVPQSKSTYNSILAEYYEKRNRDKFRAVIKSRG